MESASVENGNGTGNNEKVRVAVDARKRKSMDEREGMRMGEGVNVHDREGVCGNASEQEQNKVSSSKQGKKKCEAGGTRQELAKKKANKTEKKHTC